MKGLVELHCFIDDFWKEFKTEWDKHQIRSTWPHGLERELSTPETMTIVISC